MRRLLLLVCIVLSTVQIQPSYAHQEEATTLTVANWTFDVQAAIKAPYFMDTIHLGMLDDGRDWLVVKILATNTSGEKQELHSDKIQLRSDGELIKQTGDESEGVANELGATTIGGSFPHDIEAGKVFEVIQVYKVAPNSVSNTLVFDFSGEWEVPLDGLIAMSAGSANVLGDGSGSGTAASPWTIETASYRLDLIGAVAASTFNEPFHLGGPGAGYQWLVLTFHLANLRDDETEVKADSHQLLVGIDDLKQSTEETKTVSSELGISMLTLELTPRESTDVAQVFKVPASANGYTLKVSARGKLFIDLTPVVALSNGDGNAVAPGSAIDLAMVQTDGEDVNAAPTAEPTTVPINTEVIEPTAAVEQESPADVPESTTVPAGQFTGESGQDDPAIALAGRLGGDLNAIQSRFGDPSWTDTGLIGYNSVSLAGTDAILVVYYDPDETVTKISIVFLERPASLDATSAVEALVVEIAPLDGECEAASPTNGSLVTCSSESLSRVFNDSYLRDHGLTGDAGSYQFAIDPTADEYFEVVVQPGEIDNVEAVPEPTIPPTVAAESGSASASSDELEYATTIILQTQQMADSLNRFSKLAESPQFFSDEWKLSVVVELAFWQATYQEAAAMVPPPRFAAAHVKYVEGLAYISQAADEIAFGIDTLDGSAFDRAVVLMNLGNAAILEANEEIRAVSG